MNIVYVVKNEDKLIKISQLVSEIYPNLDYIKIPAWDCLPYDNVSPSARITGERINSFIKIGNNKPIQLIIITVCLTYRNLPRAIGKIK
jgi:transcription-repair coupling factor (superfamily II helicase)